MSMSRWPFLNRRSMMSHPCSTSHFSAIRSPFTPIACRNTDMHTMNARPPRAYHQHRPRSGDSPEGMRSKETLAFLPPRRGALNTRAGNAVEIREPSENVARLGAIGWPEDPRQMQLVDDPRGAPITDLEAALQQRRRAMLVLDHDLRRFAEQLVAIGIVQILAFCSTGLFGFPLPDRLDDVVFARTLVDDETLRLERGLALFAALFVPTGESLGVLAGDVRALQPRRL